jgi:type VI secretion system ImpC/EvpB family protein
VYVEAVDAAIAFEMRALLHAPALQRLEAAWRGLHWLISSLDLDDTLQLHVFDVTREEILADIVAANGTIAATGLYRALVDRWRHVPGAEEWTAFVTLFEFDQSDADVGLLAALGLMAAQARAPMLGGAAAMLSAEGVPADEAGWHALRRSEVGPWIGLGAPRVLLRVPYGARTDPITAFAFEEVSGEPAPGDLLWGNAAFALALLIGRAFRARGWDMEPGDEREIGEMPAYTFTRDGESHLQPCSERPLSETQWQKLLDAGLIPVACRRDRPAVVVIRFQSVAHPPAALVW